MNRDDEFFRLPKAKPKRTEPAVGLPAAPTSPEPPAAVTGPAPSIPPIVQQQSERAAPVLPAPAPAMAVPPPVAKVAAVPPPVEKSTAPVEKKTPEAAPPAPPPPPPPPSGPAPRRALWLWPLFGVGVIGAVIVGGMLGYWAFMNVAARLLISDQPLTIQLPQQSDIVMRTDHKIDVLMKGTIYAQVPLKQTLDLPVNGTYDTIVDIDTQVPLETVITYEGIIPVDSMADIEAKAPVNFQNVKKYKNLHFKAKLPLKMRLPVKLVVPVKQMIPLKYHGPLKVTINHVIKAPVDTTLNTALKVNQVFSVPITTSLPVRLQLPQHPVKATIVEADLNLDISTLRLQRKPQADAAPAAASAPPL